MFKKAFFLLSIFILISCNDTSETTDEQFHGDIIIDCAHGDFFQEGESATYVVTQTKLFNGEYTLSKASNGDVDALVIKPNGDSKNYTFTKGDCSYFAPDGETNAMAFTLVTLPQELFDIGVADYLNAIDKEGNALKELPPIVTNNSCVVGANVEPWSVNVDVCTGDFELEDKTFIYTQELTTDSPSLEPPGFGMQRFKIEVNDTSILEVELTLWNFK